MYHYSYYEHAWLNVWAFYPGFAHNEYNSPTERFASSGLGCLPVV